MARSDERPTNPMGAVTVVAIHEHNWSDALAVEVTAAQLPFVADYQPVALTILAKAYLRPSGDEWEPLAFRDEGARTVGVVALVYSADACRVRHFAIDAEQQKRGLGGAAMAALIDHVRATRPSCRSMVVTFHPDNDAARRLYTRAGFVVTGVQQNGEPVCSLALRHELDTA